MPTRFQTFRISIVLFFCLSSCLSSPVTLSYSQSKPPKWIDELPFEKGYVYAVGLAKSYTVEGGQEIAFSRAKNELGMTLGARVRSVVADWLTTGSSGFVSEYDIEISVDEETLEQAEMVESWVNPESKWTYVLARLSLSGTLSKTIGNVSKKVGELIDTSLLTEKGKSKKGKKKKKKGKKVKKIDDLLAEGVSDAKKYKAPKKPDWVNGLPTADGALFAVGFAEGFYWPVNGREEAQNQARVELGKTVSSRIEASMTTWFQSHESNDVYISEQDFFEEIAKATSEASLEGSQIIESWYDDKNKWYYALARISLDGVLNSVNESVGGKIKGGKPKISFSEALNKIKSPKKELKQRDDENKPLWLSKPPSEDNALFVVGISEKNFFRSSKQIEAAKLDGRTRLAKNIETHIQATVTSIFSEDATLDAGEIDDYYSELIEEVTNVSLQGTQVLSFWRDEKRNKSYALVYLPLAGLRNNVKRTLKKKQY